MIGKQVLIVDDDPRILEALRIRFQGQGYETLCAMDAILARDLAVRHKPDLLLIDISLPGGNGLALAQHLRSLPELRRTPFILITASQDPDLRRKAMQLRASGLFEKPYDAEELLATARFAMGDTQTFPFPKIVPEKPAYVLEREPKKIVVVEDDRKIALALALRLKAAGYEASLAFDAVNAINTVMRLQPDLVLLDISLPAGDGFTVAERLRSAVPKAMPFIFMTASKEPGLRQRAEAMGAAGFFEKPYEPEALIKTIRQAVNG